MYTVTQVPRRRKDTGESLSAFGRRLSVVPRRPPRIMTRNAQPPRRPRVLYLAFYFPPTRASGVYRGLATANHFAAAGWDVTVFTPEREFFRDYIKSFDDSLDAAVRDDLRVERVHFPGRAWERDIRKFSWFRGNFPVLSNKFNRWAENRFFPEAYSPWIPRVVKRARQLHAEQPFDLILATGNPHASFAAAWMLRKLLRIPYVVDYRDSWTLNLFHDELAYPEGSPAITWEARVLRHAAKIVFVNDALLDWHRHRYPFAADRMTVVQNGWEPGFLGELPDGLPDPRRPLRFGYLGTVTTHVPIEEFFSGWRLARKEPVLEGAVASLYGHLGFFPSSAGALKEKLPLDEGIDVTYEGPVAKTDVGKVYAGLDVLLLILAGARYVTSGKVYEYMATGKPIVSVHDPQCAASKPLAGYPLWFPVRDLSPESVRDAVLVAAEAARGLTAEQVQACRDYAAAYTRDAQLAPFERELRGLVDG